MYMCIHTYVQASFTTGVICSMQIISLSKSPPTKTHPQRRHGQLHSAGESAESIGERVWVSDWQKGRAQATRSEVHAQFVHERSA